MIREKNNFIYICKEIINFFFLIVNESNQYFIEYFKRNMFEKFQDYVLHPKLQIVRSRAKFTNASFQETASELDFTDSSHLNKMMKKYTGKTM